jgi:hypothetical protein
MEVCGVSFILGEVADMSCAQVTLSIVAVPTPTLA